MNSNEERDAYDRWLAEHDEDYDMDRERMNRYRTLAHDLPERPGTRR